MAHQRLKIDIEGIVQGVGFRPFVFKLAQILGLHGSVWNHGTGVTIEAQGAQKTLDNFLVGLEKDSPPLARIFSISVCEIAPLAETGFKILESVKNHAQRIQIPSDCAICPECLSELFDPNDRRYRYPFINCTNCGPRYTIIMEVPYDRRSTTMRDFNFCKECFQEYQDPDSRRFHAQPNACPDCGPQLCLLSAKGSTLKVKDPVSETLRRLHNGEIVAIKSLGGYHLAVDAANQQAVQNLRNKKKRDEKPFAIMVKDLVSARRIARVSPDEAKLLESPERPIVLLHKKINHELALSVAPNNQFFGIMLPYAPLHHLLLEEGFVALVMTSANDSDEPTVYEDDEALQRLSDICDVFLMNNRRIHVRADDSIARVMAGRSLLLRRSRGFVPASIRLPSSGPDILAVGAELKNTICITSQNQAYLGQHIGDLKNLAVYNAFLSAVRHLQEVLEIKPSFVAHDYHPDYQSSRFALEESGLECIPIQHHHAHLASCLAESGLQDAAIGVIFDGIGYGSDGHMWGGEFLVGDLKEYKRCGHFHYQPMPGGDLATKEPWRMSLSYLSTVFGDIPPELEYQFDHLDVHEKSLVLQAIRKQINTPLTSSCGRLFDAVASLLGLRRTISFEGQAAMDLEMIASPDESCIYPFNLTEENEMVIFQPNAMIASIVRDYLAGINIAVIAGRFHSTLGIMIEEVCSILRSQTGLNRVVLSGGVFQNLLLTEKTVTSLEKSGFEIFIHSRVPPNDGGVSLGQAAIAAYRLSH